MKILITGITGFIGSHLSQKLLKSGHEVHAIIRNPVFVKKYAKKNIQCFIVSHSITDLLNFFQKEKFDGVVHCASCFLADHKSEEIYDLISANILFSTQLLESAQKTRVNWFINTGTFWQHYDNNDYSPVNLYAATKQAFEAIARYYLEVSEINFVTVKLSDTYGPNDTRQKIFNLWKKIAATGQPFEMSPGEQYLDIVYIDDVVAGYVRMIELLKRDTGNQLRGRSFAVSSGNPLQLKELAAVFEKVAKRKLNITWGAKPYRPREVMTPWNRGEAIPGWKPKVPLEEGIAALISHTPEAY